MWTIWGKEHSRRNIRRGVMTVIAERNGGMLLAKRFAEQHIPMEILDRIPFYRSHYCFEEDHAIYIPLFFIPSLSKLLSAAFYPKQKKRALCAIEAEHARCIGKEIEKNYPSIPRSYPEAALNFVLYARRVLRSASKYQA